MRPEPSTWENRDEYIAGLKSNSTTTRSITLVGHIPWMVAARRLNIEKDPHDTSQKAKESQDTSHKILELQKKLDSARSQIKRLPGIEYSKEEQLQKLETLRKQLRLKRELLLKYRNTCTFEIPKV
ncbi:Mediator of RNA polymerase II transcription subunit 9 [Atta colombica]|uniref:Mediator of RNA polymerase II transcription subunit 9 n=1 Tax=Atta colombica TaxID=520822 RepID=A0A151I651_9HYME|nr:Mediator of RNA polymerase II transcription subunit 9 [Atta colombica]